MNAPSRPRAVAPAELASAVPTRPEEPPLENLEETLRTTAPPLAGAPELKTELAIRVGQGLGLDPQALQRLELGAHVLEIGVLGIPAVLLTKPSPLTDEERELIATHPELSTRIGAPIERLEDVRPIVRARHERFDGRGYPDGLCADEIPIEARILHACDAFHTLTTVRPYRARLPVEEARRRLAEGAGTQFDPRVVDVCLRLLETPGAGTVSAVTESL